MRPHFELFHYCETIIIKYSHIEVNKLLYIQKFLNSLSNNYLEAKGMKDETYLILNIKRVNEKGLILNMQHKIN
jgi:hypothetical protein